MKDDELRARFEAWYIENTPDYSLAPLGSRDCGLQWKAWQACHAAMQGEDVRRDAMSSIEQIAHRWAMASYAKALGRPFEDIDSIRRELEEQIDIAMGEHHG